MTTEQLFHIGQKVYYVKESYGVHEIIDYNSTTNEYLLELKGICGGKFWSVPERLFKS